MSITIDRTIVGLEFRPLTIPASVDAPDAGDFVAMTHVRNRIYRWLHGHDDQHLEPAELLPHYLPDEYELRFVWLVLLDGEPVGRLGIDVPLEAGSKVAYWLIELLPEA